MNKSVAKRNTNMTGEFSQQLKEDLNALSPSWLSSLMETDL